MSSRLPILLLLAVVISPIASSGDTTPEAGAADLEAAPELQLDANLPNVLILGDSISIGYTPFVQEMLTGKANVVRPQANCGDTRRGLANIDNWLGDTHWDVIHFNWGLHDLCYRNPEANKSKDKINGKQAVPVDEYKQNLDTLVSRLKATGAALIWASTTVVPEGESGRFVGDDTKYNTVAAEVMKKHDVTTDDLHALTMTFPPDLFSGPGNVHFAQEGSRKLAEQVAAKIAAALARR